jgi:hypothetical protein
VAEVGEEDGKPQEKEDLRACLQVAVQVDMAGGCEGGGDVCPLDPPVMATSIHSANDSVNDTSLHDL